MIKSPGLDAKLLISRETSLKSVIAAMTDAGQRIILVCDRHRVLEGVVTDYDIRVSILNHVDMATPASEFMNRTPVTIMSNMGEHEIFNVMERTGCQVIPVLDPVNRVIGLRRIEEFAHFVDGDTVESTAIVMAGGLGTRLRPMTDEVPKPLLHVGNKPILFTLLDQLLSEKFDRIYVAVNYKSEAIMGAVSAVASYRDKVEFIVENEPMGTAGALGLLPDRPTESIVIVNGDLLTSVSLKEMLNFHSRDENEITVALKKQNYQIPYGVATIDGTRIVGMEEKPDYTIFINTGAYAVAPSVLDWIDQAGHCDMTDVIQRALDSGQRVGSFPVHEYWLDIGTPDQFERAREDYVKHFS